MQRIVSAFTQKDPSQPPAHLELYGSWGSLPPLIATLMNNLLARPVLYITAHIPAADNAQDDIETFCQHPIWLLPAAETDFGQTDPTSEIACQRLNLTQQLRQLANLEKPPIIAASITALMQPVASPASWDKYEFKLNVSQELTEGLDQLLNWLTDHNFTRTEEVDTVGEFACRGGIIDIFPPDQNAPLRIELFGDQIESLRFFDLDTKRSVRSVNNITITGCQNLKSSADRTTLFTYLPENTLLVIEEMTEVAEIGRIVPERLGDATNIYPIEQILGQTSQFDTLYINRFSTGSPNESINLGARSLQNYENRTTEALNELTDEAHHGSQVFFFCENPAQRQRITEIIDSPAENNAKQKPSQHANLNLPIGFINQGFALPDNKLLLASHHEIFARRQIHRRIRSVKSVQAIETFTDLEPGDLIVHVSHGIARFRGLKTLTKNGRQEEYLTLEYADKALIHLPAGKIELVHKYVGSAGHTKLSRLGTQTWQRQKEKVTNAVEDLASQMIELQAHRNFAPGIKYPPDTTWQKEFEQSFPYQDTNDQHSANIQIKTDMQQNRPMDRLLCGDVGYGKTELALRAAFKAIEHGHQVALLVPTTVLAEQHYHTFTERLSDFPFNVEALSRFKTAKQAREIIERTIKGQVDILIGTHRILSPDVIFKNLGLVIIDEEQRFGVAHKERLKHIRKTVDILTMTATPLPRSLHMALLGIRDISSLTTPPLDRRSIVTEICPYSKKTIYQAITKELSREGQVYFLHNRVHNILTIADSLQQLIPDASIITAHGQMPKRQLENRMTDFVNRRADVLVCTTIIESGLDIPNANTIIINDADRFGLAELHQLRGRVGRYKNRAYAYMLLPAKRAINPTALKRLKAIEEYSQLGSGFRIALRDLEIRGAGNILGFEQSGHIDAVGYELYCRLLAVSVQKLQGKEEPPKPFTHLELNINNNIPVSYISSPRQRMDVYRRLATCTSAEDLQLLEKDLLDLCGKPPASVQDLLQLAEIKILASNSSIRSIVQKDPDIIFTLQDNARSANIFYHNPGTIRIPDQKTIHMRLGKRYFETPSTMLTTLRKILTPTS